MPSFIDQTGNTVELKAPPRRIVSLVPSQTELLFDLGIEEEVVGITKFCVHPTSWRNSKVVVGGTKNFDFNAIDGLSPDLIIGNKEENYKTGIEALKEKYPVWMSDIFGLNDALHMIEQLGLITQRETTAVKLCTEINDAFKTIKECKRLSVLYLIWRRPWMAAAKGTFINSMLELLGLRNVLNESRYPELTDAHLMRLSPDVVLLSSEPYPFSEKHLAELSALLPQGKIILVDGEMFSWYGSRLKLAPEYFNTLDLPR